MRNEAAEQLDRARTLGEDCAPMSDADYVIWLVETKAKIAASIADPRPPVPIEQAFERLRRELDDFDLRD